MKPFDVIVAGVVAACCGLVATCARAQEAPVRVDGGDWFAFTPHGGPQPSVIGMESWLDAPAGKHGGLRMVGDHLEFGDVPGAAVKLWGTNLSYQACAPERDNAEMTARRFARFGINAVRLHKFTGAGWEGIGDPNDSTKFDAGGLSKLDFFTSRLAANGVYYGFSHTYHFKVRPANKGRIAGYDDIEKNLKGDTYGLIHFADDVQDLLVESVVNLLKHKNPYTGKTYAEDSALAYVELHNEDDIFFYTSEAALKASPFYAKKTSEKFSAWLLAKYGSADKLASAWGGTLKSGESLGAKNIAVQPNPWFMSDENLGRIREGERRRMMDNAAFFHELQNAFYDKYVKAIRAAGFKGVLVGSPWQAPASIPHYYNLRSDALVGMVDRHNYYGDRVKDTMLGKVGSGILSTGLQQVMDRPFCLSEWISQYPDLYSAEMPVIVAAYGMGLQGWSASFEFNSDSTTPAPGFAPLVGQFPWGLWNVDVPTQIGQYPALARMVLRGDVKQGEILSVRKVSPEELHNGSLGFQERIRQTGDIKTFGGEGCPPEALAAGRCLVQFTEKPEASTFPEMRKYMQGQAVASGTGELLWNPEGGGIITINTAGTKGVVGFADGKTMKLGELSITMHTPYASVLVTAMGRKETLADAQRVLVTAVARNSNKGFTYIPGGGENGKDKVTENGSGPIMLEPVKAQVNFANRKVVHIDALDFDGRTMHAVSAANGMSLDTGKDKAIYFVVELEK